MAHPLDGDQAPGALRASPSQEYREGSRSARHIPVISPGPVCLAIVPNSLGKPGQISARMSGNVPAERGRGFPARFCPRNPSTDGGKCLIVDRGVGSFLLRALKVTHMHYPEPPQRQSQATCHGRAAKPQLQPPSHSACTHRGSLLAAGAQLSGRGSSSCPQPALQSFPQHRAPEAATPSPSPRRAQLAAPPAPALPAEPSALLCAPPSCRPSSAPRLPPGHGIWLGDRKPAY